MIYARTFEHSETPIDFGHLRRGYEANRDGFGFMAWQGGKWVRRRQLKATWEYCRRTIERLNDESGFFAVHFRYRTAGPVSLDACHPFKIAGKDLLMHNGTVPVEPPVGQSDSQYVASQLRSIGRQGYPMLSGFCQYNNHGKSSNRFLVALDEVDYGAFEFYGPWHEAKDGVYSKDRWVSLQRRVWASGEAAFTKTRV